MPPVQRPLYRTAIAFACGAAVTDLSIDVRRRPSCRAVSVKQCEVVAAQGFPSCTFNRHRRFSNAYAASSGDNQVLALPAGWTAPTELPFSGLSDPFAVAVDTAGNVYVTDLGNSRIVKLPARS